MAPLPQTSSSPSSSQPQDPPQPKTLPGMKRGIAIGVAASVAIIAIALLTLFVTRKRKQTKAQQLTQSFRQDEKQYISRVLEPTPSEPPSPAPLVEADTRIIYELDANPTPELPTKDTGRKAQELDGGSAPWAEKIPMGDPLRVATLRKTVPSLYISPPEVVPSDIVTLLGASPIGASPVLVSPLESVYFAQTPRSARGWV